MTVFGVHAARDQHAQARLVEAARKNEAEPACPLLSLPHEVLMTRSRNAVSGKRDCRLCPTLDGPGYSELSG